MVEVYEIIKQGIINDNLSYLVFQILAGLFMVDIFLYFIIWINLLFLNWEINNGTLYKQPLREILQGFEELLDISTHQVNTAAYIENFFSKYKVNLLPLVNILQIPVISAIKFIKNTVSLFILVGVLGTFVGIYSSLVQLLNPDIAGNNIIMSIENITPVLEGMGTAFATSIVGMSFALMITFIIKLFNAEQFLSGIMSRLENYLDNEVKIAKKSFLAKSFNTLAQALQLGFRQTNKTGNNIYNALKGFETFSRQFEEAAAYMETFNTDLAGSMEHLEELYQTNKEFTESFSKNLKVLEQKFDQLYSSIDEFTEEQTDLQELVNNSQQAQTKNVDVLEDISKVISAVGNDINKQTQFMDEINLKQEKLVQSYDTVENSINQREERLQALIINIEESLQKHTEKLQADDDKLKKLYGMLAETADQQQQLVTGYDNVMESFEMINSEMLTGLNGNIEQFNRTLEQFNNEFNGELAKNSRSFREYVDLSNNLLNKGFDSIIDRFENLDLVLGKYLSGLSFNASNLEHAIRDMNETVQALEEGVSQYHSSLAQIKQLIRENKEFVETTSENCKQAKGS